MTDSIDPQRLALGGRKVAPAKTAQARPKRQRGKFLKGPVPWSWLTQAGKQPGKAIHVAIVLRFLAGLKKSATVPLSGSILRAMGVDRHAGYRGLKALERAKLVAVERHRGRSPVVTLLEADEE